MDFVTKIKKLLLQIDIKIKIILGLVFISQLIVILLLAYNFNFMMFVRANIDLGVIVSGITLAVVFDYKSAVLSRIKDMYYKTMQKMREQTDLQKREIENLEDKLKKSIYDINKNFRLLRQDNKTLVNENKELRDKLNKMQVSVYKNESKINVFEKFLNSKLNKNE